MASRRRTLLALASAAGLTGCLGDGGEGTSTETPIATPTPTPAASKPVDWVDENGHVEGKQLLDLDYEAIGDYQGRSRVEHYVDRKDGKGLRDVSDRLYRMDVTYVIGQEREEELTRIRFRDEFEERSSYTRVYQFPFGTARWNPDGEGEDWAPLQYRDGEGVGDELRSAEAWFKTALRLLEFEYSEPTTHDGVSVHRLVADPPGTGEERPVEAFVDDDGIVHRLSGEFLSDGSSPLDPDPDSDAAALVEYERTLELGVPEPDPPEWTDQTPRLTIDDHAGKGVYELDHHGGATLEADTTFEVSARHEDGHIGEWDRALESEWEASESRYLAFVETDDSPNLRFGTDIPDETVDSYSGVSVQHETDEISVSLSSRVQ